MFRNLARRGVCKRMFCTGKTLATQVQEFVTHAGAYKDMIKIGGGLVSVGVGVAYFVFEIRNVRRDIDKMESTLDAKMDKMESTLDAKMDKMEANMDKMEAKMESMMEASMQEINNNMREIRQYIFGSRMMPHNPSAEFATPSTKKSE